jgi:demethylmenaquinone methyltransferase/2-methoxy-6-polyprenyl-1,4-benzoquinol methylase
VSEHTGEAASTARLVAVQREFYDLRAPDFGDLSRPDRKLDGRMPVELVRELVDRFAPTGDVLELACGNGGWTRELLRHSRAVTAVDGSARMLERNRQEVGDPSVTYIHADLFAWQPDHQYDAVFFGFWLSHVPPAAFDQFWDLVRSCLRPGGRVAFTDEDDRGVVNDDIRLVDGVPVATRKLHDGRRFDVVKLYWDPAELEARVRSLGWDITITREGETFLYGSGR